MNGPCETVEASRPREQVFAFATDLSSFPVWLVGVWSGRPGGEGPVAEGSTARGASRRPAGAVHHGAKDTLELAGRR